MTYDKSTIVFEPHPTRKTFCDLTGQRFARLTVLGYAGTTPSRTSLWYAECQCGTVVRVQPNAMKIGRIKSCGCLNKELQRTRMTKHGAFQTPTYKAWQAMRKRVSTACAYRKNYADRGIIVCDRWNSFSNFLADMGEKPEGLTLDRIDNNGNYEPSNCRWATMTEQLNNKRDNHRITYRGRTQTLSMWARELHKGFDLLNQRLIHGWSIEKAFTSPLQKGSS